MVDGKKVLDRAGEFPPRRREDDHVITDSLEVGNEMRGEHHSGFVLCHHLHEPSEEVTSGERVQAGNRFVEKQ